MGAKYVQTGHSVDYTPVADVKAGDVVVQSDLVGVAKLDIKAGTLGALAVTGVFEFPKATGPGSAIAAGAKVWWDTTVKQATTVALTQGYLGKAVKAASDADATVRVRVSQ
jgi:predicted RecA/RadA family phage recombinase